MNRTTKRQPDGFTLVEMLVAVAIMAVAITSMSFIFRMSIDAYRASAATSEIMRNLRAITDQLDADFKNIRGDGPMFLVWLVDPVYDSEDNIVDYVRSDRVIFFTTGDFQSFNEQQTNIADESKHVRGNVARISYMLAAREAAGTRPIHGRNGILARSQHIVTADPAFMNTPGNPDMEFPGFTSLPNPLDPAVFEELNNTLEYDTDGVQGWLNMPRTAGDPDDDYYAILSAFSDIFISGNDIQGGLTVDKSKPETYHMMLCEGIGNFSIQGWAEVDGEYRWFPMIDPAGDGNESGFLADTDFFLNPGGTEIEHSAAMGVMLPEGFIEVPPDDPTLPQLVTEESFDGIPGFGKAVKFTFTLYDSRGVFPEGRTFTHIVYLDN